MKNIGYYNGEVGLIEEVKIPMLDRGMYFGDGVYEATFAINNKIFALEDHLDRLYSSAALLDINIPNTRKEISDLLEELTSKVDSKVKFIYWQITRGTAPRKHIYPKGIKGNLYITITPFSDVRVSDKKLKLITVEDTRFLHCNIKTLNLVKDTFINSDKGIVCVGSGNNKGNPVIFSKKYINELLSLEGDIGGKKIIKGHLNDFQLVNINDEIELVDIDTQEEYVKIL